MLSKNNIITIGTKFTILLANFLIVVFTTQLLGSTARGEIALIIANISLITIFTNIFCGSTVAFHVPRLPVDLLLFVALSGAIILSLFGSVLFAIIFNIKYFQPLFIISLFVSLSNSILMYWLGKNNLNWYNILSLISPASVLIYLAIIFFAFNTKTIGSLFTAYYFGFGTTFLIGLFSLIRSHKFRMPHIRMEYFRQIFLYGFNNELNYFIQFLNYRLSYYFIAKWIGLSQLGIFSVVVSIAEAVWIISKSMSAVHFSNVINSPDKDSNHSTTTLLSKQSLWISMTVLGIGMLLPESVYLLIFGEEFGDVKILILYLLPGVTAIAVSNLYGNYFAAIGKLKILRNKSLVGLFATLILLPVLITKYRLPGVCITLNVSYIISSVYLFICFRKERRIPQ